MDPENKNRRKPNRVAVCVYTTNAAQTLRAVEISKAIRGSSNLTLRFFTYRGKLPGGPPRKIDYEHYIRDDGFEIEYFGQVGAENEEKSGSEESNFGAAVLDDEMWSAFLRAEQKHLGHFPPPYDVRATPYLRAIIQTLSDFEPNVVLLGLFPEVLIASKIKGWNTVAFAPLPIFCTDWMKKNLFMTSGSSEASKFKEDKLMPRDLYVVLEAAANAVGGFKSTSTNFRDNIRPNRILVCDFECFYNNDDLPSDVTVIGPVISKHHSFDNTKKLPQKLESFFDEKNKCPCSRNDLATTEDMTPIRVFLTMGSTANLDQFIEAVKAIVNSKPGAFKPIVAVPLNLEGSNELDELILVDGVLVLRGFVPALPIMEHVDVIISHGGQSTVQSAFASGVPIVATFTQMEQRFNLMNAEKWHTGVCVRPEDWNEVVIRQTLLKVGSDQSYKEGAIKMKEKFRIQSKDALTKAVSIVLDEIYTHKTR